MTLSSFDWHLGKGILQ